MKINQISYPLSWIDNPDFQAFLLVIYLIIFFSSMIIGFHVAKWLRGRKTKIRQWFAFMKLARCNSREENNPGKPEDNRIIESYIGMLFDNPVIIHKTGIGIYFIQVEYAAPGSTASYNTKIEVINKVDALKAIIEADLKNI